MEIKTKFNVGDKVKVLADPIIKTTCPFCKGQKFIMIGDTKLYCQNCDDGVLKSRMNHRQLVDGVITGIKLDVKDITSEDDEWWYNGEEGQLGVREEYCVEVADNYWGNGTYESSEIQEIKEE